MSSQNCVCFNGNKQGGNKDEKTGQAWTNTVIEGGIPQCVKSSAACLLRFCCTSVNKIFQGVILKGTLSGSMLPIVAHVPFFFFSTPMHNEHAVHMQTDETMCMRLAKVASVPTDAHVCEKHCCRLGGYQLQWVCAVWDVDNGCFCDTGLRCFLFTI